MCKLLEVSRSNYYYEINRIEHEDETNDDEAVIKAFDDMPNPSEAVKVLKAYGISQNSFNIEGNETLTFLDEIQMCK